MPLFLSPRERRHHPSPRMGPPKTLTRSSLFQICYPPPLHLQYMPRETRIITCSSSYVSKVPGLSLVNYDSNSNNLFAPQAKQRQTLPPRRNWVLSSQRPSSSLRSLHSLSCRTLIPVVMGMLPLPLPTVMQTHLILPWSPRLKITQFRL